MVVLSVLFDRTSCGDVEGDGMVISGCLTVGGDTGDEVPVDLLGIFDGRLRLLK